MDAPLLVRSLFAAALAPTPFAVADQTTAASTHGIRPRTNFNGSPMNMNLKLEVLTLAIGVALSATDASAQTTANGPYYASPSWDQTMPTSTRFVVLSNMNNEAVLDRETGLVWQQNPSPITVDWVDAVSATSTSGCPSAGTGGRSGWRLPRLDELQTLTTGAFVGSLPAGHPFGVNSKGSFWVANVDLTDHSNAIVWNIGGYPGFGGSNDKQTPANFWCVRSPSSAFSGY